VDSSESDAIFAGVDDPGKAGLIDLLGALAYGELSAFERMASDSRMAPNMGDRAALSAFAAGEFTHFQQLCLYLTNLGVDPDEAMAPYVAALDTFHDLTAPADWLESLVKAYVGDGIARDFYREASAYLDPPSRDLVRQVLGDVGHAAFAVDRVRAAIAADPRVGGRLALWARRLVGEALTQAQRVAVEREGLVALLASGAADLAELGRLFQRVIDGHSERMRSLGLSE
jgi:tRNA-(MS[2]IO[6]A)-hydroxylase (MiaE)-like